MASEIIEFYKNANNKGSENNSESSPLSSVSEPFGNFLMELADKLKDVKLDEGEKLDLIKEVVEDEKKDSTDSFSNFLNDFSKIVDEKIDEGQVIKHATIDFINELKEKKTEPEKKKNKKIPNKFIDKIKTKEPILENEEVPTEKENAYVGQMKSIDKTDTVPEKVKSKTDIKSFVAKQVKDEIEKFKVQFSKIALEGTGGSVAVQYANGGTMNGNLNVTGKYLSAGVDIASLFGSGGSEADRLVSGSQSLVLNPDGTISFPNNFIVPPDGEILNIESETNTSELSGFTRISLSPFGFFAYDNNNNSISFSTTDDTIVIASKDQYEWKFNSEGILEGPNGTLTVNGLSSLGEILSGGIPLHDIFLTSETDSQTLTFTESSAELSISNGNTVSLSALIDYETIFGENSAKYEDTLTTVQNNSGNWDYQGTDLKELSGNWQATYETVGTLSAQWGLDSQTLTFTESSAELSISNGNTIILSALESKETFESVSKNLKSFPYVVNYSESSIYSIVYTLPDNKSITKSFSYTNGLLTSISLSGNIPFGIDTLKTLNYTVNNTLTGISYS